MVEGKHRYLREVDSLLLEGEPPGSVDRVIEDHQSCGMTMGQCRMPDPAGVDIASHVLLEPERQGTLPAAPAYRAVLRWLHAEGRLGQKFGLGYCRYDRRKPVDDEAALRVFKTLAAELGVSRRGITKQEIVEQLLYPMINEGAIHRGGPTFKADGSISDTSPNGSKRMEELSSVNWGIGSLAAAFSSRGQWPTDDQLASRRVTREGVIE